MTLRSFYPHYLSLHANFQCLGCHVGGFLLAWTTLVFCLVFQLRLPLLLCPLQAYGLAWYGHFHYAKNRPATFEHPLYAFLCYWAMLFQFFTGQLNLEGKP